VRADPVRARHRVSKLLLRHGIVYSGGRAWTDLHHTWLHQQHFDDPVLQATYECCLETVELTADRRDRLDVKIRVLAETEPYAEIVHALMCLRGISVLTAFALTVEVGDWTRFTGKTIGAYLGLVPTEHSSGASRAQGSDTQDRQHPCPSAAGGGRLAPPPPLPADPPDEGPVGQGRPGLPGPGPSGQPPAAPPVGEVRGPPQAPGDRHRGHRPRVGRLVLVVGRTHPAGAPMAGRMVTPSRWPPVTAGSGSVEATRDTPMGNRLPGDARYCQASGTPPAEHLVLRYPTRAYRSDDAVEHDAPAPATTGQRERKERSTTPSRGPLTTAP
jgi:hypothetical protein